MKSPIIVIIILMLSLSASAQFGTLDQNFGTSGIQSVAGTVSDHHASVAIDNQNRILLAGSINGDIHVCRFSSNGQSDLSFGTSGTVIIDVGIDDVAEDILIQPDQKILVAGSTDSTANANPIVLRLNSDGTIDNSFGNSGVYEYKKLSGSFERFREIGLLSNGSIIALMAIGSGSSSRPGPWHYENIALIKLSTAGVLDQAFADTGIWRTNWLDLANDRSTDFLIQSDDKIVVPAAFNQAGQGIRIHAFRFDQNGQPDSLNFGLFKGQTDWYYVGSSFNLATSGVGIQSNGKILVSGTYRHPSSNQADFFVMRFDAKGIPDSSFNTNSLVVSDFFGSDDRCHDLVMQGDEFILVGEADSFGVVGIALARYLANGSLDSTFGNNGFAYHRSLSPSPAFITEAALLSTGNLIAAHLVGNALNLAGINNQGVSGLRHLSDHKLSMKLSPNPVNSAFSLSFKLESHQKGSLELYDMTGRSLHRFYVGRSLPAGRMEQSFSIPEWISTGTYFLRYRSSVADRSIPLIYSAF